MPEHVHVIVSEPKQRSLALTLQMIKQMVSRKLRSPEAKTPFWSPRYCDFNLWTDSKRIEKVRLYASQSGEEGSGRKAGGLGMEQLPPLPQWRRRSGGNRVAVDST